MGRQKRGLRALRTLVSIAPFSRRRALSVPLENEISVLPDGRGCMITPSRSAVSFVPFSATLITLWACYEPPTNPPTLPSPPAGRLRLLSWLALARKREREAEKCRGAKCHAACYVKPSSLLPSLLYLVPTYTHTYILYLLCIRVSHRTEPEFSPQFPPGGLASCPLPPFFSGAACP